MREGVPRKLKQTVGERANGCCEYCMSQAKFAVQPFAIEHIRPRCHGGKTMLNNLALACQAATIINITSSPVGIQSPATKFRCSIRVKTDGPIILHGTKILRSFWAAHQKGERQSMN